MDSKIKPDKNVREGRVVIHPHNTQAYIFSNKKWNVIVSEEDDLRDSTLPSKNPQKTLSNEAYDRAMGGII